MANVFLSSNFPGEWRKKDNYAYFLPGDIFITSELVLDFKVQKQLEQANFWLGKFSATAANLPNVDLFIGSYLNKEAVKSTKIEGTQIEINDSFHEYEVGISAEKQDDWKELRQYIVALNEAIEGLSTLPLCERLIRRIHKVLLSHNRGKDKLPGEYRKSQNWIDGSSPQNAHFVPPAPEIVPTAMNNIELFIHDEKSYIPDLIKIALIHYQFETIHPFLDGNGRVGRILIPLYLLEKNILQKPILYISNFFEKNRNEYYDALDSARNSRIGVIKWLSFFLFAVIHTAKEGIKTTSEIIEFHNKMFTQELPKMGRRAKNGQKLLKLLFGQPVIDSVTIRRKLSFAPQVTHNLIADFLRLNIIEETTGQKRNRIFAFEKYLTLLQK